jgi:hypothetical protein
MWMTLTPLAFRDISKQHINNEDAQMSHTAELNPTRSSPQDDPRVTAWNRDWTLVRADLNMARDLLVKGNKTTFALEAVPSDDGKSRFKIVSSGSNPLPRALVDCFLELKGEIDPQLQDAGLEALPAYDKARDNHFDDALDQRLIPYLDADMRHDDNLTRLEGTIKFQCPFTHMHVAQLGTTAADPHILELGIRLYRFKEGINDGAPGKSTLSTLLVMWAPDSPRFPANPDGTALGIA